ncbi:hypothetical protein [Thermococcus barophilus]|uniref:Water stress and hypersensitive response domain-containing protein n=1 Tax=Thermococcus barophilus TaxID=55802 RepID=A0A0S1XE89_THEBA|nr:hypothetical protein [Thermococcus barophilus]ALM76019.1 conserved exported hypothetical protein [Thermococcus barophilus]
MKKAVVLILLLMVLVGIYYKAGDYIASAYVSEVRLNLIGVSDNSVVFRMSLVVSNPITLDVRYAPHNLTLYYDDHPLAVVRTSSGVLAGGSKNTIVYEGRIPMEALKQWFYYHAARGWRSEFYIKGRIVVQFGPVKAPIYVHSKIKEVSSNPFTEIINREFLGREENVGYYKLQYPSVKFSGVTWDGRMLRMKLTYINNSTSPILVQFPTYEFRANNITLGTTVTDSILIPGKSTVESEVAMDTQNIEKFLFLHFANGETTVFEISMEGAIKYLGITKRGKIFDIKFTYRTDIFSR